MPLILIPQDAYDALIEGEIDFGDLEELEFYFPAQNESEKAYKKKPIDPELRWEVFERDNFTCKKCGSRKNLHADHITPESKGGETSLKNLQTLCRDCNIKKGTKQNG